MSEVAPAKCRVEIFRGPPYFFDDHFLKYTWTPSYASTYKNGDIVNVYITEPTWGKITHTFGETINTNPHRFLVIRVTALTGTSWFIEATLGGTVQVSKTFTDLGVKIIDLYAEKGAHFDYDRITVGVNGATNNYVQADYYAVCKQTLLVPIDSGDVVEQLTITKPVLSQGIGGAQLTLPNFNGALNGEINKFDNIIIWLTRTEADLGKPDVKEFGGRIIKTTNRANEYGAFYIDLDCHAYAHELNVPPSLFQKAYSAVNGRTIIEDALAVANYITKHPLGPQWFDSGGASGNTDDRINSTHDVEYDEVLPMSVIQEILDKACNPNGVVGFDIYEMPSGVLIGHLRNSLDFTNPTTVIPASYEKGEDIHRVQNKVKVYGAHEKNFPSDLDSWTDSLSGWTANATFFYLDTDVKRKGSYSLYLHTPTTGYTELHRTFDALSKYGKFVMWVRTPSGLGSGGYAKVRLWCPDSSNYFEADITSIVNANCAGQWGIVSLALALRSGELYNADHNPSGIWTKVGNPQWYLISGLQIIMQNNTASRWVHYDGDMGFINGPFSAIVSDSPSIAKYGVRTAKPISDDSLYSDSECQAGAQSIVEALKDPVITLSNIAVDGDHFNPADRQRIIVSNDNFDAYFAILQFQHQVVGPIWDSTLSLSLESECIDYVFRKLKEATE